MKKCMCITCQDTLCDLPLRRNSRYRAMKPAADVIPVASIQPVCGSANGSHPGEIRRYVDRYVKKDRWQQGRRPCGEQREKDSHGKGVAELD